jgi:hypothetical protein
VNESRDATSCQRLTRASCLLRHLFCSEHDNSTPAFVPSPRNNQLLCGEPNPEDATESCSESEHMAEMLPYVDAADICFSSDKSPKSY